MLDYFDKGLELIRFNLSSIQNINHGIEKESLRINPYGQLSQTCHPVTLGTALSHPYITTDFSENLLEFITPVFTNIEDAFLFLSDLHTFTASQIGDELFWCNSMPCRIDEEHAIPIAQYGSSNVGKMKHIYRKGLELRYGKTMQTIAGIHYNVSFYEKLWEQFHGKKVTKDEISEQYMALIRNFHRYAWLLLYLFGASPGFDVSFLKQPCPDDVYLLENDTYFMPWATSLRMSDVGYTNKTQQKLNICYNSLSGYIDSLSQAIKTPYSPYVLKGIKKNGEYIQLNTNILQIENEYYTHIRPKRIMESGEKPLSGLIKHGIQYIEVRCIDIDPFAPLGIHQSTANFLDVFLLFCLLQPSPMISEKEDETIKFNFNQTTKYGRKPKLILKSLDSNIIRSIEIKEYMDHLIERLFFVAEAMDKANKQTKYTASVKDQLDKINDVDKTPSSQILDSMTKQKSFFESTLALSKKHTHYLKNRHIDSSKQTYLHQLAKQSVLDQKKLENIDSLSFDSYLHQYFND